MHDVFYVDIYLILNLMMNFFLLVFTAMIRQKRGVGVRLFCLSLLFAGISTASTYFFWHERAWRMAAAIFEAGGMVYLAFLPASMRDWRREMATFLSLVLLTGGGMTAFFSIGTAFFAGLPVSAAAMFGASLILMGMTFWLLRRQWAAQRQNQQTLVWVELSHRERTLSVKALVDTGNRLVSPYTGEDVWIVSQELAERLALSRGKNPIYIPFQSLGGSGLWEAYRLELARVEGKRAYENVLVAVSPHLGEMDEIQMILNIMRS